MSFRPEGPSRAPLLQILALLYFVLFALAVTWPGFVPLNRVYPLILGLPFNMFWILLWAVGGGVVLFLAGRGKEEED